MRVLRRRADNVVQAVSFGGLALLLLALRRDLFSVLVGLPLLMLATRTLRNGVYVNDDAVVVRNTFRSFRVPWAEFDRLDLGRAGRLPMPVIVVRRHAGKGVVPLWCIQPPGRGRRGRQAEVDMLDRVQKAVRAVRP
jgi:hypothetical protein